MVSTPADRNFAFSEQHQRLFEAVADRIVPMDDTPGAVDAGAVRFILGLLNSDLRGEQAAYLHGLNGVEQEARALHGKGFIELAPALQDAVLAEIEADRVRTHWIVSPRGFFLMMVEHVLEGFYADPGNGGNRDAVSWKMMGYKAEGGTW